MSDVSKRAANSAQNQIDSELRRLFGNRGFDYVPEDNPDNLPPVRIEVKAFPAGHLGRISDTIIKIVSMYYIEGRPLPAIATIATDDVLALLRPYVTIPDSPQLTIDMLPVDVLPDALAVFIRGISPGKWQALGREMAGRFGLKGFFAQVQEGAKTMTSPARSEQSGESKNFSEG